MFVNVVLFVMGVWLVVLTWIVYSVRKHYNHLISATNKKRIDEILDQLVNSNSDLKNQGVVLKKAIDNLAEESKTHIQKIGVSHFHPFEKSGSDQSFVLALLDKQENGIVLNFIYTPEGLRVYPSQIKDGKTSRQLTQEEQKAIAAAH